MDIKGKECLPELSAKRFERILDELGIQFHEQPLKVVDGACSLILVDQKHGWHVNGKGTDEQYCRASAFGEAMERLQTRYAYAKEDISSNTVAAFGFTCSPDEEMRPMEKVKDAGLIWADFRKRRGKEPEETDISFLQAFTGSDRTPFVPYYSVREQKEVMLPENLISLLAGTNGMAAGNTCAEALCQCLCEIAERYVKFLAIRDGLTPPEIPDDALPPEIKELKRQIEERSGFKVHMRDMSLGRGFPVLGLLMVDEQRQRYRAKFGAHPSFAVAAERCLTELLQGYDPGDPRQNEILMLPWSGREEAWNNPKNLITAFRMDLSLLPDSILAGPPSWEFQPWGEKAPESNEEASARLCRLILSEAPDMYIRNTGFLGVPCFRVYVPGVTLIPRILNKSMLRMGHMQDAMNAFDKRPLQEEEAEELLEALEDPEVTLGGWEHRAEHDWSLSAAKGLMHYMRGDDEEARLLLEESGKPRELCMARYLELEKRGISPGQRDALLELFFGEETAHAAIAVMQTRSNALNRWKDPLGLMAMLWENNAPRREEKKHARQLAVDELHRKIKEKMISGMPKQRPEEWLKNPAALQPENK